MNLERNQPNPEIQASQDVIKMLGNAARKREARPGDNGVIRFSVGKVNITLYGEANKGPHPDTGPWIASIGGELPGKPERQVRVTSQGLKGFEAGFSDDGNTTPLTTTESLQFVQDALNSDEQIAA